MKLKKYLCIIVCLICVFVGCAKSNSMAWLEKTEALQQWYALVQADVEENTSMQEYVDLFLDCHEEELDYGMAYITTSVLCETLDLYEVATEISDEELVQYFSDTENLYLLDFTMPMFETYYFEEDTVKYVQAATVSFASFLSEKESVANIYQLCTTATSEEITMWKNNWMESIGVEGLYEPHAVLAFERNDEKNAEEYPYVLSDSEANWYFYPDDVKEYGYKAFFEEYLIVEELMLLDFSDARALFEKYLPENVETVDIYTMFYKKGVAEAGLYKAFENHIELYENWGMAKYALLHEYVHYLTMGIEDMFLTSGAFCEGIAEEAAVWGCENRLRANYLNSTYDVERMKEIHCWDEEKDRVSYERMTYAMANTYCAGVLEGSTYGTVTREMTERPGKIEFISELSYQEMASITHYLIELYGREAVYAGYYSFDHFQELVGKDFVEIYDEWGEWNQEQCDRLGMKFTYE